MHIVEKESGDKVLEFEVFQMGAAKKLVETLSIKDKTQPCRISFNSRKEVIELKKFIDENFNFDEIELGHEEWFNNNEI